MCTFDCTSRQGLQRLQFGWLYDFHRFTNGSYDQTSCHEVMNWIFYDEVYYLNIQLNRCRHLQTNPKYILLYNYITHLLDEVALVTEDPHILAPANPCVRAKQLCILPGRRIAEEVTKDYHLALAGNYYSSPPSPYNTRGGELYCRRVNNRKCMKVMLIHLIMKKECNSIELIL